MKEPESFMARALLTMRAVLLSWPSADNRAAAMIGCLFSLANPLCEMPPDH